MTSPKNLLATGICAALLCTSAPALAGDAELALLQSYIGDWSGTGVLTGGEQPEDFSCRMTIKKGNGPRINYAGRCTLISMNLSVSGTIYYNDDARRYEGAMSSNTSFSDIVFGYKQGNNVVFNFDQSGKSDEGEDMTLSSQIILSKEKVSINFNVTFADSGDKMTAKVPFTRN